MLSVKKQTSVLMSYTAFESTLATNTGGFHQVCPHYNTAVTSGV